MNYQVRITQSSGAVHLHPLNKSELTIGSDGSTDVSLAGEEKLQAQHILFAPRAEHCWVSTAKGAPLWDAEGQPVQGAFVPWGSRLSLGSCAFELQALEIAKQDDSASNSGPPAPDKASESSKTTNSIFIMLLLSALAYLSLGLLEQPETLASALPSDAPELFEADHSCASRNPEHRARAAEDAAFAKSERSVFEKQDGVSAVELFAEAEACYRAAKDSTSAALAAERGMELRLELEEEFKLLRMRLSRALHAEDRELARVQLHQLLALLHHRKNHRFVLALRRLQLQLSKEELPQ